MTQRRPKKPAAAAPSPGPSPRGQQRQRIGKLTTARDCRKELGRLYRLAAAELLDSKHAARLTYMLLAMVDLLEGEMLAERVGELEVVRRRAPELREQADTMQQCVDE